jgi:hypothetical protein
MPVQSTSGYDRHTGSYGRVDRGNVNAAANQVSNLEGRCDGSHHACAKQYSLMKILSQAVSCCAQARCIGAKLLSAREGQLKV